MLCKSAMGSQTKDNFMYENGYGSQRNRVRIMPKSTFPISGWNGKGNKSPNRELKLLSVITVQGPRSKFSSGGAKEECVKENFLLNYFLFNLFLFLQKSGGAKAPPAPLSAQSLPFHVHHQNLKQTKKETNKQKTRHHLRKSSENPNVRQTKLSPQVVNEFIEKSGRAIN